MKKFTYLDVTALIVWPLPVGYLLYVFPQLPAAVPMHYGINGDVDRYGSKTEFLVFQVIMIGVALLMYLLLKFLPLIDPKRQVKYGEDTFQKLALGLVVFLSALNIVIMFATIHHGLKMDKVLLPLIGLLFAFIGNMMHSIKPNYFAGVRTPWTLENEDNWRSTHRLAGKLWFFGGIALVFLTLLLPGKLVTIAFIGGTLTLSLIPIIYSYIYFKNHQPDHNA